MDLLFAITNSNQTAWNIRGKPLCSVSSTGLIAFTSCTKLHSGNTKQRYFQLFIY